MSVFSHGRVLGLELTFTTGISLSVIMQDQTVFHNYISSYVADELVYGDMKNMPSTYQPQVDFLYQYQGQDVRIAQQEENTLGNGGTWGLEHMPVEEMQKPYHQTFQYSSPSLALDVAYQVPSYFSQTPFYMNSTVSGAQSTNPPDMMCYSNDSSPFMSNYALPSEPQTPITPTTTPLLSGQYYTAPGIPGAFYLVPVMARDPEGNITTMFYPKQTVPEPCIEQNYPMSFHDLELEHGQDITYHTKVHYTPPQEMESFDYVEHKADAEEIQDDGPELVGMGLYDEPPELLYSTVTTPELARLNTPGTHRDGRGLVLEQSFGPPEDEDEDEGEDEYEYEEEQ